LSWPALNGNHDHPRAGRPDCRRYGLRVPNVAHGIGNILTLEPGTVGGGPDEGGHRSGAVRKLVDEAGSEASGRADNENTTAVLGPHGSFGQRIGADQPA